MIYLMRHGEIDAGPLRRFIGRTDLPLNETGRHQAREWHEILKDTPWQGVFCSDLVRAVETAEIITGGSPPVQIMPELREIHLGAWEGKPMSDIRARFPLEWAARGASLDSFRPPGGESFSDLARRVMPVFQRLADTHEKPLLIVGHAGVNRVILCRLLEMPLDDLFRLEQDYAGLTLIHASVHPYRLKTMNCSAVLEV